MRRQVDLCEVDELAQGAVEMLWRGKRSVPRPRLGIGVELDMNDHRRLPERANGVRLILLPGPAQLPYELVTRPGELLERQPVEIGWSRQVAAPGRESA